MIRCTKCQTVNPGDALWCSGCSSFLEWTGVRIDAAEAARLQAEAELVPQQEPESEPEPAEVPPEPAPEPKVDREPAPEPEPEPEPETKVDREPEPPPPPEPEPPPPAEPPLQPDPEPEPVRQGRPEPTVEPEPPPPPKPEPPPPAEPQPQAVSEPAQEPEPELPAPPEPEPKVDREPEPEPKVDREPELPASAEPQLQPDPEPTRPAEPQPQAVSEPAPEPPPPPAPPEYRFRAAPPAPASQQPPPPSQPVLSQPPPVRPQPLQPPTARSSQAAQPAARRPTPAPPSDQPDHRQPTTAITRSRPRPVTPPPTPVIEVKPGDLVCPNCGTGNDPVRRFCRRCGNSLAAAVVAIRPPWYRRIFRRNRRAVAAGTRPRHLGSAAQRRGIGAWLSRLVALVLILVVAAAAAGYVALPDVRSRVDSVIGDLRARFMPETADVHPLSARGRGVGRRDAELAVDDNTATYWLADPAVEQPTLTVEFGRSMRLGAIVVHSGSATDSEFTRHRRPRQLVLSFPGTDQPPIEVELGDDSAPQSKPLDTVTAGRVVVRVAAWFESGAGGDQLIALREIEFKELR
ncbi:hypothetical protein BH23CHL7_BH23CHL7_23570 [soil metagenome]